MNGASSDAVTPRPLRGIQDFAGKYTEFQMKLSRDISKI